jgi:hypothetical protein
MAECLEALSWLVVCCDVMGTRTSKDNDIEETIGAEAIGAVH